MKYLILHGYSDNYGFESIRVKKWIERMNQGGFVVDDFVLPIPIKGMRLPWHKLDYAWNASDPALLRFYEELAKTCENYDVLINFGAINLHPGFLEQLSIIKVLLFRDDPESTEYFSKPVALYHDLCAVGNIAEVDAYKSWGHKHAFWLPNGFWNDDHDPNASYNDIFSSIRDVDVTILCERLTQYRKKNLDKYTKAFPHGEYYGKGWPKGFLPESERIPLLKRTKIGINIHNSTGPINFRTFYLPANGVLQICDNKSHLGKIFQLDKEVIGYENIEEAIEKTRYYLDHESARLEIAQAGYQRTMKEYNEIECFRKIDVAVRSFKDEKLEQNPAPAIKEITIPQHPYHQVVKRFIEAAFKDLVFKTNNFFTHKLPRIF